MKSQEDIGQKSQRTTESDLANQIFDLLSECDIWECTRIISQLLILLGLSELEVPDLSPEGIISFVMNEKKEGGETIYTALAQQGLLMATWREQ